MRSPSSFPSLLLFFLLCLVPRSRSCRFLPFSFNPSRPSPRSYEILSFQSLVKTKFDWVGTEVDRVHGPGKWVRIDAGGTVDEVREAMANAVDELSAASEAGGVKAKLWTQ